MATGSRLAGEPRNASDFVDEEVCFFSFEFSPLKKATIFCQKESFLSVFCERDLRVLSREKDLEVERRCPRRLENLDVSDIFFVWLRWCVRGCGMRVRAPAREGVEPRHREAPRVKFFLSWSLILSLRWMANGDWRFAEGPTRVPSVGRKGPCFEFAGFGQAEMLE
ncbi:MAG: hypothetical protein N2035_05055 [Chthoniobacterales bacterium]|nr:hypothetical protein [Chthoniobacterales bacterium]